MNTSLAMKIRAVALLCLMFFVGLAECNEPDTSSAQTSPQTFTVLFENDLFGDSDAQYTNGLKLSWLSSDLKQLTADSGVPDWLLRAIGRLKAFEHRLTGEDKRQFNVGLGIGQMMFTPDDTQQTALIVDDRPYAGWLYGALTFVSKSTRIADTLEIQLGVIGPASLAEQAQKFVHDVRDLPQPQGWDNQLENEPGLLIFYERKWLLRRHTFTANWGYDVIGHAGLALGNVSDYLALGGEFRLGWNLPRDFGTSLIRPGGDNNAPSVLRAGSGRNRFGVYAFTALGGRAIARDIFLDGNTFRGSHDVDKKHFVGDAIIGVSVLYQGLKISFAEVFRSKEFDGQRRAHNFGSVSISLSF